MTAKTIIILGRGHSGSRAITAFLISNGFFMGSVLNATLDKEPFEPLSHLAKTVMLHHYAIRNKGNYTGPTLWHKREFRGKEYFSRTNNYLKDILDSKEPLKGAKNASLTFIYELLTRQYPDFYYLYWTRSISEKNEHRRGDAGDKLLREWGFPVSGVENAWKIYYDLVNITPKPRNFLHVRFEDFILDQDKQVARLEKWLDVKLPNRIEADYTKVFENDHRNLKYSWLNKPMRKLGYIT